MASSSSSADVVGSTDKLILQILSCLPAKPLTRLKLVSKHWESLITTHQASFLRKQGPLGLICPGKRIPSFEFIPLDYRNQAQLPFSELRFPGREVVLGGLHWISNSCNGLLLCCNAHSQYLDPNFFPPDFYNNKNNGVWSIWFRKLSCCVYNPTKKCFAEIPRPGGYSRTMRGLNLAYDPVKSPFYKVLYTYRGPPGVVMEIYSSESRTWRLYDKPCISSTMDFNGGVYWNGSMHWIGKELMYFNLDNEEFEKVSLPSTLIHNNTSRFPMIGYFGESGDHLHVIEICDENKAVFNLHEMKRDYSGWFVRYRVDLPNTINIDNSFRIFSLVRGDEGKCRSFLFFFDSMGKFTRWNLDFKTVEDIIDNKNVVTQYRLLPYAFQYIESLANV